MEQDNKEHIKNLDKLTVENVENLNNGDNKNEFIPINGGYLQFQQYIKLIENNDYFTFQELLRKQRIQTSEWDVEGDDWLVRNWSALMYAGWNFGAFAVLQYGNERIPMGITATRLQYNGDIKEAEGHLILASFLGQPDKTSISYSYKLTLNNSVFGKYNYLGISQWYFWFDKIKVLRDINKAAVSVIPWLPKKAFFTIRSLNNMNAIKEVSNVLNPSSSLVMNYGRSLSDEKSALGENKFEELKLPNSNLADIISIFEKWDNLWNKKNGIEYNMNYKLERNISDEFAEKENWFAIKRSETKKYLKFFIDDYNKFFNAKAQLIDKREFIINQNNKMESNNMGDNND